MSEDATNTEKVIGLPKDQYLKINYGLLLLSGAIGAIGVFVGVLGTIGSLAGLAGLVLALLGLFVFKDRFNETQQSHFKYIGVLFLIFFVVGIVFGAVLGGLGIVSKLLILLLNIASLACMFAGFKLNEKNTQATKDNVINQLKSLGS